MADNVRYNNIPPWLRTAVLPPNPLVAALVYDGLCSFEFGCVAEVLGRAEIGAGGYRFAACAIDPGPLNALGGVAVQASEGVRVLAQAGTVIIPGWKGPEIEPRRELLDLLRGAHAGGARILAIGSGVFVLAATGLLHGKAAACPWQDAQDLARRYPGVRVEPNALYVDEGQLVTSAGGAASLDACLHLVRRDFGPDAADAIARRLAFPPHREGGQAQFMARPQADPAGPLAELLADMRGRLHEPWSVPRIAAAAGMSERTFLRRFREATGASPADWLIAERVERAREILESRRCGIDEVAEISGFGATTTLRHHFQRRLGLSPAAYRDRFRRRRAEA